MSDVVIENVGPIASATITIPDEGGGVLVLRGDQGTGKTTGIEIINALVTKRGKLIPRDLTDGGSVKGFGGKIKVGGTTTRSGDVEVASLEGRFDFADLIDPPIDKPEARAAKRIQSLIGLAGVKPDISAFYDVVGGKDRMDALLAPKDQATADLVELAGKIKRAVEAEAAKAETLAESAEANARTAKAAAEGVDLAQPDDAQALQDALIAATTKASTLKEQRKARKDAEAQAAEAKRKLADHEAGATQTIEGAQAELDAAIKAHKEAVDRRVRLETELAQAKESEVRAFEATQAARKTLNAVSAAESAVAAWREQIAEAEKLPNPSDEDIVLADTAAAEAREAMETGVTVRYAKDKLTEAEKFEAQAKAHKKTADALREQAKSVFGVLTKQIPAGPLYIVGGQLVVDTADRKAEPYDRLSDGERWKLAIPYAVDAVGGGGIICCPQDAWQHLSPASRSWVANYCREHEVWIVTGEVADGDLRAEVYEPQTAA